MNLKELKNTKVGVSLKLMNRQLVTAIVLTVIALLFFGWSYAIHEEDLGEPANFADMVANGDVEDDQYVSVNITREPRLFGETNSDEKEAKYYFLWNGSYLYIGYLDYDTYQDIIEDGFKNGNYTIYGKTKVLSKEMIQLAIEAYNRDYGEEFLTSTNYANYIGYLYIDAATPLHDTQYQNLGGVIFAILALGCYVLYFINRNRMNRFVQSISKTEWNRILDEMEQDSVKYDKKLHLYLTENYVIDVSVPLQIIKYKEIVWMYQHEIKQYGMTTLRNIILVTKDKKKHTMGSADGFKKQPKKELTEIMEWITSKNPEILVGFTKENKEQAKDLYGIE